MSRAVNVEVRARRGEHHERLIRRFRKKVKKEGFLDLVKDRKYYEKPSAKRKRQKYLRKRNAKKAAESNRQKLNNTRRH